MEKQKRMKYKKVVELFERQSQENNRKSIHFIVVKK